MRDARASELPGEDEQGGKFQQVEGLTTVDAEEILCEFSVEDDFVINENAEGVGEEVVKPIVAVKKKELDAMEQQLASLTCAKYCRWMRRSSSRDGKTYRKGTKWRCRFVAREFRHDDQEMERFHTSGSTTATSRLVDMHAVQHGYSIVLPCRGRRGSLLLASKRMGQEVSRKRWSSGKYLVEAEETASREKESCFCSLRG